MTYSDRTTSRRVKALRHIPDMPPGLERNGLDYLRADFKPGENVYHALDRFELYEAFAKMADKILPSGMGYANVLNALADPKAAADAYYGLVRMRKALRRAFDGKDAAIVDGLGTAADEDGQALAGWTFAEIARIAARDPHGIPKCIYVPVGLDKKDALGHMVVVALEWDAVRHHCAVSFFEQHVRPDGSNYDFSKEQHELAQTIKDAFAFRHPTAKLDIHYNDTPFCRIPNVCPIVSFETIKTLAFSDKPPHAHVKDVADLMLNEADMQRAHEGNLALLEQRKGKQAPPSQEGASRG